MKYHVIDIHWSHDVVNGKGKYFYRDNINRVKTAKMFFLISYFELYLAKSALYLHISVILIKLINHTFDFNLPKLNQITLNHTFIGRVKMN